MSLPTRLSRHLRLSWRARNQAQPDTPPFLILFINSICNLACDHCFYWKELNQRDDLTKDELLDLAVSLGPLEILNLSGGEPFLRPDFGEVVAFFVRNNGVKQIYCPTNGYFADRTRKQLEQVFEEPGLDLFAVELSLDGMPEFHNEFRRNQDSFQKAMETYDMLAEFQRREPRLQIHAISTATGENLEEIQQLTTYLFERCPEMSHHNIAMLRGERKRPTLVGPGLDQYRKLAEYTARLWAPREEGRFGGIVDPMLHWGKIKIAETQSQAVPCRAGILTGVVYANGDVSLCEQHEPLGNLRQNSFPELWGSAAAVKLRRDIQARRCFCTNEVFLWPSLVFQPVQLARAMLGSKAWSPPQPLLPHERVEVPASPLPATPDEVALPVVDPAPTGPEV